YARRSGRQAGTLEDVFVNVSGSERAQVLVARSAGVEVADDSDERFLVLRDGYRYDGNPGQADYRVLHYREYALHLQTTAVGHEKKWDEISMQALWATPGPRASAELHKRLSRPVTVLVLALIAIPLARFRPATSPVYPLWLGVLVFALYFNLLGTGQLWIEQGRVPGWLGLWWVHGLLLAPLLVWAWKRRGWSRQGMA
ncbi:MAG TPA: LptF/LptG family permease, partial [Gammaproteobacteria bacterium]|nr:LptF/LptG family permease [Gammaproteobacteria bacterium]